MKGFFSKIFCFSFGILKKKESVVDQSLIPLDILIEREKQNTLNLEKPRKMKKIQNTIGFINIKKRVTFDKFLEEDTRSKKQRTILLLLNSLQKFLVEKGIVMKQRHKEHKSSSLPSLDDIFNLNRQKLAILDQTNKTYNLVYHVGLHNQMLSVLFLALFNNKDAVVQKIFDSGFPTSVLQKCMPIYLYFCAIGNVEMISSMAYKSIPQYGLGANILLSFRGLTNLGRIDFDFMTVKQFLLLNEYRGIKTIYNITPKSFSDSFDTSCESKTSSTTVESDSDTHEMGYTDLQMDELINNIDQMVLFPLDFFCIRTDFKAIDALLQHTPAFASLSQFCFLLQCHAGITLKLLHHQANPDQSFRGYTPLHISCRLGNLDVTAIFLGLNADMQALDYYGKTPRYYAELHQHTKVIELLDLALITKILPKISTEIKFFNYTIFENYNFKDRLELTKGHLIRALMAKNTSRFKIVALFTLNSPISTTQGHIDKLKKWEFEEQNHTVKEEFDMFKYFISRK